MDFEKMLSELRAERELIDKVIANIEDLAKTRKRGPGRPPGSLKKGKQDRSMNASSQ